MSPQAPRGPFCQSCSMPLEEPEDFGTRSSGDRVNDYCRFCYRNGAFVDPDVTMHQMIDRCVGILVSQGRLPESQARAMLAEALPRMKRWRKPEPPGVLQGAGGRGMTGGDEQC